MVSEELKTFRKRILENLTTLASVEEQRKYQKEVPFVNVPDELFCGWFDDLNMPKSLDFAGEVLSQQEIEALRDFSNSFSQLLTLVKRPNSIALEDLLKNPDWQTLIVNAASLYTLIEKGSDNG